MSQKSQLQEWSKCSPCLFNGPKYLSPPLGYASLHIVTVMKSRIVVGPVQCHRWRRQAKDASYNQSPFFQWDRIITVLKKCNNIIFIVAVLFSKIINKYSWIRSKLWEELGSNPPLLLVVTCNSWFVIYIIKDLHWSISAILVDVFILCLYH